MRKPALRTTAIVVAALCAIAIPVWQFSSGWGMSAAAFSAQGDSTLRVEGYAFSIWSLLYLGMVAYALYQALPSTRGGPLFDAFGWPSALAMLGCGLWIMASAANAQWLTIAIITISAGALVRAMVRAPAPQSAAELWLVTAPLSLLAGWLTVASAVNILTVLTAQELITPGAAFVWAIGGILSVTLIGVALARRAPFYPLPIAWGLLGAVVAQRDEAALLALACGVSAFVLVLAAARGFLQRRRGVMETAPADASSIPPRGRGWR